MKYSKYNSFLNLNENLMVLYNSKEDKTLVFHSNKKELFLKDPQLLEKEDISLYNNLLDINAIIEDSRNELDEVIIKSREIDNNNDYFKLIVNPTMSCNFSCWYCYESHIIGSKMSNQNIEKILKYIDNVLFENPDINTFDLSFFGGEPLMYYSKVTRPIIDHYRTKYEHYPNLNFEISFTSNGYLLNDNILTHLLEKNEHKHFQITLDGNREEHNKVRVAQKEEGSYDVIIASIKRLLDNDIEVLLRVNYTAETLYSTSEILEDIKHFSDENKNKLSIDFHRVWQDNQEVEDIDDFVDSVLNSFVESNFNIISNKILDNYNMPCYADKKNEAVINFNGDVYKCTARDFTKENSYGSLNEEGKIVWNEKIKTWENLKIQSKACQSCRILPLCGGGCHQINLEALGMDICQMGYDDAKKDEIILNRIEKLFFNA